MSFIKDKNKKKINFSSAIPAVSKGQRVILVAKNGVTGSYFETIFMKRNGRSESGLWSANGLRSRNCRFTRRMIEFRRFVEEKTRRLEEELKFSGIEERNPG